jgi:hypothetical protein
MATAAVSVALAKQNKPKKSSGASKPKSPPSHPPFLEVFLSLSEVLLVLLLVSESEFVFFVIVLGSADDYGRDCDSEGEDGFEPVRYHEGH